MYQSASIFALFSFFKCLIFQIVHSDPDVDTQILHTTEAFYTPLWLNKTMLIGRGPVNHLEVMASLSGHADLPYWMKYFQRRNSPVGYFYGTPPLNEDGDIDIDIIILNKINFNTTSDRLKYRILNREKIYHYEVEMKFFELDLQDFFQRNLISIITEIFARKLWKKYDDSSTLLGRENSHLLSSLSSVYLTKVARPIDVGGRFPLDPNEKECVIVRIGSTQNFTEELLHLETEVKQIKNREPCPKRYKATTVEYVFRERKLHVDWCSFKLIRSDSHLITEVKNRQTELVLGKENTSKHSVS